ncbi:unnamed protein product [Trichobilharzia regenti]|nr:unnamed protein product [Trichobilharzia regenti]
MCLSFTTTTIQQQTVFQCSTVSTPNDEVNQRSSEFSSQLKSNDRQSSSFDKRRSSRQKSTGKLYPSATVQPINSSETLAFEECVTEKSSSDETEEENLAYIKPSYGFTVLSPSQNIKFARDLSNDLLLAYSVDGSVQVISINPIVTLLHWVNIHECNSGGVIAAEFYKNLNTLITCGSDGLLTKIKLKYVYLFFLCSNTLLLRSHV